MALTKEIIKAAGVLRSSTYISAAPGTAVAVACAGTPNGRLHGSLASTAETPTINSISNPPSRVAAASLLTIIGTPFHLPENHISVVLHENKRRFIGSQRL